MFVEHVYGRLDDSNLTIEFNEVNIDSSALEGITIKKDVIISFSNGKNVKNADLLIYLPQINSKPSALFLGLNFYGNHTIQKDETIKITSNYVKNNKELKIRNNRAGENSRGVRSHRWPIEILLKNGYGIATIYYGDLDPDFHDGFNNGIHSLINYNNKDKKLRSSLSAWAFGLSKAMDYFEIDKQIDHNKIIVIGHSRLGKAALWAGARDKRFAMVISNNSGCGGAALSRRREDETVKNTNESFPHWFSENFHSYNELEEKLPIDQHMLIGLIASTTYLYCKR